MCIYFLLLSWALVLLFEVSYLRFPPMFNVPGKENRRFCLLKQPQQASTGQGKPRTGGRPASKNAMSPFPKYLCAVHWSTCAKHISRGKDEVEEHHCCLFRSKGVIRDHPTGFPHQGYPQSSSWGFIGHGGKNLQREASTSLSHWLNQSLSTWSSRYTVKADSFLPILYLLVDTAC